MVNLVAPGECDRSSIGMEDSSRQFECSSRNDCRSIEDFSENMSKSMNRNAVVYGRRLGFHASSMRSGPGEAPDRLCNVP